MEKAVRGAWTASSVVVRADEKARLAVSLVSAIRSAPSARRDASPANSRGPTRPTANAPGTEIFGPETKGQNNPKLARGDHSPQNGDEKAALIARLSQ
jgi:hypothetical protein